MVIGNRIRKKRVDLDLTLEDVAKAVGTSRQTLSRYENSIITNIPYDKMELLATRLQTTPAYLMGWDENQPASEIEDGLEKEAMHCFDSLSDAQKLEALNYLRYLVENAEKK